MLVDQKTGETKAAVEGQCIMCNQKGEVKSKLGQIPFCKPCSKILGDEEEMEKRIVW